MNDYTKLERPKLAWLIPDLIPKPGLIILLGAPKVGKSFFALQLGLALAQAEPFLDFEVSTPRSVLYLQLDTSELIWRDRLLKVSAAGQSIHGPIYLAHPEDLELPCLVTKEATRTKLKTLLKELQPDFVVIDVLRELHQLNENDSTDMKVVGDCIIETFGEYATMLLHHSRKAFIEPGTTVDPINLSRGSSYITGKADAIWYLDKAQLVIESRFDEPRKYTVRRNKFGFLETTERKLSHATRMEQFRESIQQLQLKDPSCTSFSALWSQNEQFFDSKGLSRATYFRHLKASGLYDPLASSPSS